MKTEPNEPINPCVVKVATNYEDKVVAAMLPEFESNTLPGLTKREYFAGLAMQGMVTNSRSFDNDFGQIAELAVSMADTLIAQLNND